MIVADSSVWIDLLKGRDCIGVVKLRKAVARDRLLLLDIILLEVLHEAGSEAHAGEIECSLGLFPVAGALDLSLARIAAGHYRKLRALGVTIRKTADLIIGTYCIANDHTLLHSNRDFDPMARHLGLKIA